MKRIQYHKYGGPEVMKLEEFTLPDPKEDQVVVRVKAASVNPMDWKLRRGFARLITATKMPLGIGADFAGVVESVGSKVTAFKAGDEVIGTVPFALQGAFAEALLTEAKFLVPKPPSLSFEAAATLPIVGLTAWTALVTKARLSAGQKVFINGALGGVGRAAVAVAKAMGAKVSGRVGPASIADAQALGLETVLDYTKDIPADLNGQFDVVLDTVGMLTAKQGSALATRKGVVLEIVPGPGKFMRAMLTRRFKVIFADSDAETLRPVVDLAAKGSLTIPISRSVPLSDAAIDMIRDVETGKLKGKAVVVMP